MAAFAARSVAAHLFRDPAGVTVTRGMRQGRWLLVWSSPAGEPPRVYALRFNGPSAELVGEHPAKAPRAARDAVVRWGEGLEAKRPQPMPRTLALCVADDVTS